MNSCPGSTCSICGHIKGCACKLSEKVLRLHQNFSKSRVRPLCSDWPLSTYLWRQPATLVTKTQSLTKSLTTMMMMNKRLTELGESFRASSSLPWWWNNRNANVATWAVPPACHFLWRNPSVRQLVESRRKKKTKVEEAKDFIKKRFPKADLRKLEPIGFGKKTKSWRHHSWRLWFYQKNPPKFKRGGDPTTTGGKSLRKEMKKRNK